MKNNLYTISDLIIKELLGELTQNELEILNDWKIEHDDLYQKIVSKQRIKQKLDSFDRYNYKSQFERVNKKINQKSSRSIYANIIKYAAILILPISIALTFIVKDHQNYTIAKTKAYKKEISKATLTLSNGETIVLSNTNSKSLKDSDGTLISRKNNELKYKNNTKNSITVSYNTLTTPAGGNYNVILPDGTKVWLNAKSELKYPTAFVGNKREVFLNGEGFFEVTKNKKMPFIVKTDKTDIKVYGTAFNLMSYKDDNIAQTTLVEGRVEAIAKNKQGIVKRTMLEPEMFTEFNSDNNSVIVKKVDVSLYTAWKDGLFIFEDEKLESILKKMSRWYDFKTFYMNDYAKQIKYTVKIKKFDNLETALKLFEIGSNVEFELNNNTLLVKEK